MRTRLRGFVLGNFLFFARHPARGILAPDGAAGARSRLRTLAGPSSATTPRCFDGIGPRPADRKAKRPPRRCPVA